MKLGKIDVRTAKKKHKDTQAFIVFYDYYLKSKKVKNKLCGVKVAISVKFNKNNNQEIIRKSINDCFKQIDQKNIESVDFLVDSFANYVDFSIFLKIVAQELFRYHKNDKKQNLKKIIFVTNSQKRQKIVSKSIISYLNHIKINKGPFLTVDGIVLYEKGLVLIERKNPPSGWALPGGFVDYGESVEEAVKREVKEETGLDFKRLNQFKVYSKISRDPRFHTVSVVFLGKGKGKLQAASDAKNAAIFKIKNKKNLSGLPLNITFDHGKIIRDFINS